MGPRARSLVAVTFACAVVACSLGDFSGYSGGAAPAVPSDAAVVEGASLTRDAGADADAPSADASPPFCATKGSEAAFCEDFDGAGDLARFGYVERSGGTLVVDGTSFVSSPRSLVVTGAPSGGPSSAYVVISTGGAARTRAQLSAAIRLEDVSATSASMTQLLKVWFFAPNDAYEVTIGAHGQSGKLFAYEYASKSGYYKTLVELDGPPPSAWTRIDMDVRLGGSNVVFIDRDGARVVDGLALSPPYPSGGVETAIGLPYMDGSHGEWKIRIDDLLLKVQ